jgi:hypothetical protein
MLVTRFPTVRPFLVLLVQVVDFGATPEGMPVLKALKSLPDLMGRKKVGPDEGYRRGKPKRGHGMILVTGRGC